MTRHLFCTGKGGVGKTSLACSTAIALVDLGKRVLLVSTDPASNLDEVLDGKLSASPAPIESVKGLEALNIDPEEAARVYRERIVGPYRGKLPDSAVTSIEGQLAGKPGFVPRTPRGSAGAAFFERDRQVVSVADQHCLT